MPHTTVDGGHRGMYQESFSCRRRIRDWGYRLCYWASRGWDRQVSNWLTEKHCDTESPILSPVCLPRPSSHVAGHVSLVVSRQLCHLQVSHPHDSFQRQPKDHLFLESMKIQKSSLRSSDDFSSEVIDQNWVICPYSNHWQGNEVTRIGWAIRPQPLAMGIGPETVVATEVDGVMNKMRILLGRRERGVVGSHW